ncbi:TPA: hypothetical protein PC505_003924 [Morganella morganii]|nr:hypothetical protein [Morganella morganii]HDF2424469.1 hypothetical protein [Morganella morganii]
MTNKKSVLSVRVTQETKEKIDKYARTFYGRNDVITAAVEVFDSQLTEEQKQEALQQAKITNIKN